MVLNTSYSALTSISPLEIDISSSLFDIFKMSSRFAEYIVLALNEKLITGIIEFFLLFNVILSRGHREPSLFTHARARAIMRDHGVTRSPLPKDNRQKIRQNLDPDHCMIYVFGRSVRMVRLTTSVVFIFTHYCMTLSALLHTEFIRPNAWAFIKFFVIFLFEGGVYLKSNIYIKRSQFHDLYVNILLQYMT